MESQYREQILNYLTVIEEYVTLYMDDSLAKNNVITKLAELVFWITYEGDNNE